MPTSGSILGNPVLRKEDPGILEGTTQYYDDLAVAGLLHTAFVRSTVAHADISSIDTSDAMAMPGVVAVYTAADLDLPSVHGFVMLPATMNRPPLARDKVRFVGDIVAMVVADTKARAMDAAETVIVDYDELTPLATVAAALADGAPIIHEQQGSNVANAMGTGPVEGVLDDADVIVRERIVNQRVAPVPMEPGGIVAAPGKEAGSLSIWVSSQGPHGVRDEIAMLLGIDPALIHARNAAVGGGFGAKQGMTVEHLLVAKAALTLGRPVKWTETRRRTWLRCGMAAAWCTTSSSA